MNISVEPASSLFHDVESKDDGMLLDNSSRSSSRRLSIPEAFTKSSSIPSGFPVKPTNNNNKDKKTSPSSRDHPYEFEKVLELVDHPPPHDSLEDRAARDAFRPQRQYMSHQRPPPKRRASLDNTASSMRLAQQLKEARKFFHNSTPQLDLAIDSEDDTHFLTAFERKRQKQQMEEGALYAATRATERATRSWKRQTIVLGPLGLIPDEEETEEEESGAALLALLEKDATKHNASLSSMDYYGNKEDEDVVTSGESTPVHRNRANDGDFTDQAVKVQQLRQVFQKQNSAPKKNSNNNKSPPQEEGAKPNEVAVGDNNNKEDNDEQSSRKEQLRLLKIALKKAAKSKEPALMSLVLFENSKQAKMAAKTKSKRSSMPGISSSTKANNGGGKKKKKDSRSSMSASMLQLEGELSTSTRRNNSDEAATATSKKKDRRSHMLRRMSAPDFSSTVAALTSHGSSPEEALKEMATMPKHMLADIITAPEIPRDSINGTTTDKKEPAPTNGTKKKTKKKKGSRSSLSASMSQLEGELSTSTRRSNDMAAATTTTTNGALSNKSNDKATNKKRRSRRSVMKESRRSSLPDLTKMPKEDVYDWALAAKQKENNDNNDSSDEWKHIKSSANAVRRPKDDPIQPLKVNSAIAGASDALPELEALLPLLEPQN